MTLWDRLRDLDTRVLDSSVGWVLPGGAAYKLGQRSADHGRRTWHRWPFTAGLLDGWNYNIGRQRARRRHP